MSQKELKQIFHRGNCLSLETMRLYNEGTLSHKATHEVEKHLLECALCSSAIEGLNKTRISDVSRISDNINKRLAVYMNTPPQTPILSRFGVAMIVSSIVIALGITIWWLSSGDETPKQDLADTGAVIRYQPPSSASSTPVNSNPNSSERSQVSGAVSVQEPSTPAVVVFPTSGTQSGLQSIPDDDKTPAVSPELQNNDPVAPAPPPAQDDNSRVAQTDQYLRIKSVVIYPPTTHTEKKPRDNGGSGNGQLDRSSNTKGEFELDEMPTYPGGNEALRNYILTNYQPQKEDKDNLKRKSTGVMFQVNAKTGAVSGAALSFPISPLTDAELLRVMSAMPAWNPGKKRGTVDVMVGITFE
jgi:hypothetical protein